METLGDTEKFYTVFEGSSREDVAHAKVFWSSLCLQPPMESSLVATDITQRLKIAKNPHCTSTGTKAPPCSKSVEVLQRAYQVQIQDEKRRYLEMARKRDEIMALLKKQRESRIEKETVSFPHKPRRPEPAKRFLHSPESEDLQQDVREVRELV